MSVWKCFADRSGRRLVQILTAAAGMLCLTGCSSALTGQSEVQIAAQTETEIDESLTVVGVVQVGAESDWRIAHTNSIKNTFTTENGFYLIFENAQQKQENQLKAVRSLILQEVDYIILDPILETGWDSVLEEAQTAEIPVIIADRKVSVEDDSLYTCWFGSDFQKEGENAGIWLADYLEEQGRGEEQINIVTLQGTLGSSAQIGRTEGFAEELSRHDNWTMLGMSEGDFTQTKGQEAMEELLEQYDDIDVIISENDNMTLGAIDAIEEDGRSCGPDGEIIMISFDAVSAAFDCMIEGTINADFECNPLAGPRLAEIIQTLQAGGTVEKQQYIEETYFDTSMDLEEIKKTRVY